MRAFMGVIRNRHGVYEARKKVPKRLEEATARVLDVPKRRQSWRPQVLARQSAGAFDMNIDLLRAFCEQTVDARWGATFLIAGFLLQAASSAGVKITPLLCGVLGVVLLIMLAIYTSIRRGAIERRCIAAIDALDENEAWPAQLKRQLASPSTSGPALRRSELPLLLII